MENRPKNETPLSRMGVSKQTHLITRTVDSTKSNIQKRTPIFTSTVLVINGLINFIIDSRSSVTLIPKNKLNRTAPILYKYTITSNRGQRCKYQHFEGKTLANVDISGDKKKLELLITEKTIILLGLDWMQHLRIKLDRVTNNPQPKVSRML